MIPGSNYYTTVTIVFLYTLMGLYTFYLLLPFGDSQYRYTCRMN